jgi:hypothetical protein
MEYLQEKPLDLSFTRSSLDWLEPDEKQIGIGIVCGAYRFQTRQRGSDTAACPFCVCEHADREHLWWHCPLTAGVRARFPECVALRDTLPVAVKANGQALLGDFDR